MTPAPALSARRLVAALLALASLSVSAAPAPSIFVKEGPDGRLVYGRNPAGDGIVDFSHAGYGGGGVALPLVPARIVVAPNGARDGERIQAALNAVAAMPAGPDGFRGAVLLEPGDYRIDGGLKLDASGVVLRGSGDGEHGTVLHAIGLSRRSLIEIGGRGERRVIAGASQAVAGYVPVGARQLTVADASGFKVGSEIVVRRPSTEAWIGLLGMNTAPGWNSQGRLHWRPGSRDLSWDRVVAAVDGNRITLDAPITTALDPAYGGGTVARYEFPSRINQVGVENLRLVSDYDAAKPLDEEHAWYAVTLDKAENAWVRQVTALHFVSYVVNEQPDVKWLTVEDCAALEPVSEIAGYRRRTFSIGGELTLVQRCRSEHGLGDFTTGFVAAGPNVFLDCRADDAMRPSGPYGSWSSGALYDNVIIRGDALRLMNRDLADQGAGWAAANCILWNCEATDIQVQTPAGAYNQAFGCKGDVTDDKLVYDPRSMPYREFDRGQPGSPESLYRAQLAERRGPAAVAAIARSQISLSDDGARPLSGAEIAAEDRAEEARRPHGFHPLKVEHAQFTIDGQPAWTAETNFSFFMGQMPRNLAPAYGPAITRFAPGETGVGLTDDLEQMAASLPPRSAYYQHFGLWYDRRRINHLYYGSPEYRTGDAWGPFMEQPWARSGQGRDWDGLSKYDLTKFNPWFFSRLKEFADICDARGLILYENVYFQHPVQETKAHYTDFPWRPVNCLQDTGLPDENPAGATFYDLSSPVRRHLHEIYIRHCLDVLKDNHNVVFGVGREYSGPLSFVQFWLDTVAQWEKENRHPVLICLEVPKAEMDAILNDPVRGPMITAIDFHFWFYRPDGSLFTIQGGINRAPREQTVNIPSEAEVAELHRQTTNPTYNGGGIVNSPQFRRLSQTLSNGTPALRYRAWREYRDSYPSLVIVHKTDEFPALTGAIDRAVPAALRARTRPAPIVLDHPATAWAQADPGQAYLVYTMGGDPVRVDLSQAAGKYQVNWIDTASDGLQVARPEIISGGGAVTLTPPVKDGPSAAWLTRAD